MEMYVIESKRSSRRSESETFRQNISRQYFTVWYYCAASNMTTTEEANKYVHKIAATAIPFCPCPCPCPCPCKWQRLCWYWIRLTDSTRDAWGTGGWYFLFCSRTTWSNRKRLQFPIRSFCCKGQHIHTSGRPIHPICHYYNYNYNYNSPVSHSGRSKTSSVQYRRRSSEATTEDLMYLSVGAYRMTAALHCTTFLDVSFFLAMTMTMTVTMVFDVVLPCCSAILWSWTCSEVHREEDRKAFGSGRGGANRLKVACCVVLIEPIIFTDPPLESIVLSSTVSLLRQQVANCIALAVSMIFI